MEGLSAFIKSRGKQPEEGEGRHVLMIQDTTELNYNNLNGLLKVNDPDIGPISDNRSTSILLHPSLAVDALSGIPYGISSIQVWNRPFGGKDKNERGYQNLPIEEKESNKWLVAAQQSKEWLNDGNSITLVGDRENDIYEYFALVPDEGTNVLVRSSWDRKLASGQLLSEGLEGINWHSRFDLEIHGNQKRTARKARMQIKWTNIELERPQNKDKALYAKTLKIAVVEVLEDPRTVPQGESPVYWRLFTTHSVGSLAQAMQIVEWYKWRWWIEDFFRVLNQTPKSTSAPLFSMGNLDYRCFGRVDTSRFSQTPPGVVTLSRGLKIFTQRYLGWDTAMRHFQQINKDSS